ncbi:acyltransferase family protein [Micromonospora sediminicola]|uniref:acyltransferase family protein n=1 Tax=Micromonospora sediminicola TaxID=946078 RepID=UPI00378A7DC8
MTATDAAWTERVAAATPAHRERTVDALRALAMGGVVVGHWLVTAVVVAPDGSLHQRSPLTSMPWLTPISWALQTLGLFFFVSGYSAARGLARWRAAGRSTGSWLVVRAQRLLPPVTGLLGAWLLVRIALSAAGAEPWTGHTVDKLVLSPLWFLLVLFVLLPLTPAVVAVQRRHGPWVAGVPLAAVALVDLARYRLWPDVPDPLPYVNVLLAWLVPYTVGVCAARRRPGRRAGVALAGVGVVGAALLILGAHYPTALVGVPGQNRSNLDPPSLLAVMLALAQLGLALVWWQRLTALMLRPVWWTTVVVLNLSAMTVFLWHQSALLIVTFVGHLVLGDPTGLLGPPGDPSWIVHRLLWLPVFAAVLALLWLVAHRLERRGAGRHR